MVRGATELCVVDGLRHRIPGLYRPAWLGEVPSLLRIGLIQRHAIACLASLRYIVQAFPWVNEHICGFSVLVASSAQEPPKVFIDSMPCISGVAGSG